MPIDMQPRSGETPRSAHTPQNANSVASETMSRLSVDRLRNSSLSRNPKNPPSASTKRFAKIGFMIVSKLDPRFPLPASAMEMAML